jgi:HPt (histidine-containing phosphotransfer) domain-containing protein
MILPLFDLLEVLGEAPVPLDDEMVRVMIVEYKHRRAAFVVSDFLNPQKIVISEFDGIEVPGLTGTAVLSGRQLAMVVDLPRLFELTFGLDEAMESARAGAKKAIELDQAGPQTESPQTPETVEPAEATGVDQTPDPIGGDDPAPGGGQDSAFLLEVNSMLSRLNKGLLELEEHRNCDGADAIFRLAHSIKGNLTMYGAETAAAVTHRAETVLEQARRGQIELTDEAFDILFDVASYLEETVKEFLAGRKGPDPSEKLQAALAAQAQAACQAAAGTDEPTEVDVRSAVVPMDPTGEFYLSSRRRDGAGLFRCNIDFNPGDQPAYLVAYLILRRIQRVADVLGTLPAMAEIEAGRCGQTIAVILSPRDGDPSLLDRLGENLKRYFGVLGFESSAYA